MTMYHISKSGKPGVCLANTRICPLGNGEHFESEEAAFKALLDGTAKLPSYPAEDKPGHTYASVLYNVDGNYARPLVDYEAKNIPEGFFVARASVDNYTHWFIFEGKYLDHDAKLVARRRVGGFHGRYRVFLDSSFSGGEQIDSKLWGSDLEDVFDALAYTRDDQGLTPEEYRLARLNESIAEFKNARAAKAPANKVQ